MERFYYDKNEGIYLKTFKQTEAEKSSGYMRVHVYEIATKKIYEMSIDVSRFNNKLGRDVLPIEEDSLKAKLILLGI